MLMAPPPGYNAAPVNRQFNQLLGQPQAQTPQSPALKPTGPALSPNPNVTANLPPQVKFILQALSRGQH